MFFLTLCYQVSGGAIPVEKAYPIIVGSNLGTTITRFTIASFSIIYTFPLSILVALSSDAAHSKQALQIALAHCIINFYGFALFFLVPFMRWPLFVAKIWGSKVDKYKWFPVLYMIISFVLLPVFLYELSTLNTYMLYVVVSVIVILMAVVVLVNYMQTYHMSRLPSKLKDWSFLPPPLHSLSLIDYVVQTYLEVFCCCIVQRTFKLVPEDNRKKVTHLAWIH